MPFDLDATFTSSVVLLIAAAVDSSMIQGHIPWLEQTYAVLVEMGTRGNLIAKMVMSELEQLEALLAQLGPGTDGATLASTEFGSETPSELPRNADPHLGGILSSESWEDGQDHMELDFSGDFVGLDFGMTTEQLTNLANSLDVASATWPGPGQG